jgi:hypothetical protein
MKSIEGNTDGQCIGGLSGDAGSEVGVDLHFSGGAKVGEGTVVLAGAAHHVR